ncbi:ATP-binding cassette domain-containing protein [Camelimonas abortus]|uniref:ATP-binding cassette domain-containing protein n=1 Tax=Camelimonas abortus TaxID=1017184 RepID=A0ABV7LG34_9HYPH
MTVLRASNVSRVFRTYPLIGPARARRALQGVSLAIGAGETVGLVGRSGCGKSTLARLLTGLEPPDDGEVWFRGRPLGAFRRDDWLGLRRAVQMVFQDAAEAVDPRATVGEIVGEPLRNLLRLGRAAARERVARLLELVGLQAADAGRRPGQLSGGQLQRVCIARALAPQPELVILDEAVASLDLGLQLQMLELFARIQREQGVSWLFITHDLRLAARFCSRVLVMQAGRIVEEAPARPHLRLTSPEGAALAAAVLPPFPARAIDRPT